MIISCGVLTRSYTPIEFNICFGIGKSGKDLPSQRTMSRFRNFDIWGLSSNGFGAKVDVLDSAVVADMFLSTLLKPQEDSSRFASRLDKRFESSCGTITLEDA